LKKVHNSGITKMLWLLFCDLSLKSTTLEII
jgi:hypothetical protein